MVELSSILVCSRHAAAGAGDATSRLGVDTW